VPWNRQKLPLARRAAIEALETKLLLSIGLLTTDQDIGSPAPPLPGTASYSNGVYTVDGSGSGVGGTSDQFNFVYSAVTGDGSVTALLISQTNTNPSAKAGVIIRADTTAGSLFVSVDQTSQNAVAFEWRSGSSAATSSTVAISNPVWLRINDQGNTFTGAYSSDDIHWTQIGTAQSIAMPTATTLAGLWVSSNNPSALNAVQFSGASIVRGGWTDNDVGSPALPGSAVYDAPSDTTTISGNGADIFGTSDQFNFASTMMTGDGSAIAYVDSVTNTDPWAKAGVMIRNDSTAASAFAAVLVSPSNGITFEWRTTSGGMTNQEISSPAGGPTPAPVGLKLTRAGNTFTAYYSTDGINWIQVGPSQTDALNATALGGLAITSHNTAALCTAAFSSVSIGNNPAPGAGIYSSTDQLFLNDLEDREVLSFYDEASATTGLIPDNSNANGGSPSADSSIAAIGFGLSALTIGDARGWLSHANAYQRALTTITFLYNSGANNNGFFYHFLNSTGGRYGTSEVSSVDTAELMAGVLNAAQYWPGTPLQTTALAMYNRVNWPWMQQTSGVFYGAWTPESGFSGGYGDYSEASLLYLLSLGSPTHPTSQASWLSWSRTPVETYSTYKYVDADDNALFTVQYPMAWFNLQGLTDSKGLNYYQNAQTATLAQRQWMIDLSSTSSTYADYGPNLWGLTPAEGISGYTIWGGPPANVPVDGTVVPTAAGGSLEFDPRLSINVLENMKQTYGSTVYQKYGLVDAFNPRTGWTSSLVLGIDMGMTLIAAENSRSNLVWNVFDQNSVAQQSLAKAFPSTAAAVWIPNVSGNWNLSTSWANGTVPNTAGAEADLFGAIAAPHTAYSDTAVTVGTLNFNNANTYVIDGAGSLILQVNTGNAQIIVQQGTQEINLPTTITSNTIFNVAAGATLIIADPLTINAGTTLTQTGAGTVTYESTITVQAGGSIVLGNATVAGALTLQGNATASTIVNTNTTPTLLQLNSLSIAGSSNNWTGWLDITNDDLIVHNGDLADITNQIKQGMNLGSGLLWNGAAGIVSSTSAAGAANNTAIGAIRNNIDGTPIYGSLDGVSLAPTDIIVKPTIFGDADLNGKIDATDYALIDNGFNSNGSLTGWINGDFNYDGIINGDDYSLIDNAFNQQGSLAQPTALQANDSASVLNVVSASDIAKPATNPHFADIQSSILATFIGNSIVSSDDMAVALFDGDDPRKRRIIDDQRTQR
jgi:hypothetical protein